MQVVTNIAKGHKRVDTSNIDTMAKDLSSANPNLRLGAAWQVISSLLYFSIVLQSDSANAPL